MSTKRGWWVPIPIRTRAMVTEFEEIFERAPTADDAVVRSRGMSGWYYFYGEAETQVRPSRRSRVPVGDKGVELAERAMQDVILSGW